MNRFAATRRTFMSRSSVAIVGLVAAPGLLSGCASKAPPMIIDATPVNLSAWHFQTLAQLSEMILPTTDTPGAIGAGVPQYIDGLLTEWAKPETRERLEAALDLLDDYAQDAKGSDFLELAASDQVGVLESVEEACFGERADDEPLFGADGKSGYRELKKLIYRGYYHSEVGCRQELQYQLIPGPEARADAPMAEVGRSWAL